MRIGISSAVFYPQISEVAIEKICKAEAQCAEFFYNCDYEISDAYVEGLKRYLADKKTEIISVHPYTAFAEDVFFFSDYERRTEENIKKYSEIFKNAKRLGAKFLTLHGERLNKATFFGASIAEKRAMDALSLLADEAKKNGMTLCLENVAWCKSSELEYLRKVSESVDNIGFTLDLKQARRANVPYEEYLNIMGERVANVHISDYNSENDCLLPGKGEFDFSSFVRKMKSNGYKGDFIIEVYSSAFDEESQILKAKNYLETLL